MRVLLSLTFLSSLLFLSNGHGVMCTPRQRGASREMRCRSTIPHPSGYVQDYCPHCLNAGGVGTVGTHLPPGGWKTFDPIDDYLGSATRAGLCGDPKGNNDHMIGGRFMPYPSVPIVATYRKGQVVDMMVEIDTNHNGYFEFFICNLDACGKNDIDGSCFQNGHCKRLYRVSHPDCEDPNVNTHSECGPVDARYLSRWYVPCRNGSRGTNHLVGGANGHMKIKLPDDLACEHCVVQWYWVTANSCAPPDFLRYFIEYDKPFGMTCESDGGGRGAHVPGQGACGGTRIPEEFWSCADVKIEDRPGGTTSPPTTTAMSPSPSRSSTPSPSAPSSAPSSSPTGAPSVTPSTSPMPSSADLTPSPIESTNPTGSSCPDQACVARRKANALCQLKPHCEVVQCIKRGKVKFRCKAIDPSPSPQPSVSCPAFQCLNKRKTRKSCKGLFGCKMVECFGLNGNPSKKGFACMKDFAA